MQTVYNIGDVSVRKGIDTIALSSTGTLTFTVATGFKEIIKSLNVSTDDPANIAKLEVYFTISGTIYRICSIISEPFIFQLAQPQILVSANTLTVAVTTNSSGGADYYYVATTNTVKN